MFKSWDYNPSFNLYLKHFIIFLYFCLKSTCPLFLIESRRLLIFWESATFKSNEEILSYLDQLKKLNPTTLYLTSLPDTILDANQCSVKLRWHFFELLVRFPDKNTFGVVVQNKYWLYQMLLLDMQVNYFF